MTDPNGMILGGDDEGPPEHKLIGGVGESVDHFLVRNPFLQSLGHPGGNAKLGLPIHAKLDGYYDDGDLKLPAGCSLTSTVDGNIQTGDDEDPNNLYGRDTGLWGISNVSFSLCDHHLNDWRGAVHEARALITTFKRLNPQAEDLDGFLRTATFTQARKLGGVYLTEKSVYNPTGVERPPMNDIDAGAMLEKIAGLAPFDRSLHQLPFELQFSPNLAVFKSKKALVFFYIMYDMYFGGATDTDEERKAQDSLPATEQERKTVKFQVGVTFAQRRDNATQCKFESMPNTYETQCVVQPNEPAKK